MSRIVTYFIPCPVCKMPSEQHIYHSINTSIDNAAQLILDDKINFVDCKLCNNKFQVKAGLLFNNMVKTYAVYYHPTTFALHEKETVGIKKMFGDNFYLANATKFHNWSDFKAEIARKEGKASSVNLRDTPKKAPGSTMKSFLDNYWSCDICDGNSETGCLYFDPSECPRTS